MTSMISQKPMICRGILDLDVSHKKLSPITFEVTMQLLDDCSDIDSSFKIFFSLLLIVLEAGYAESIKYF